VLDLSAMNSGPLATMNSEIADLGARVVVARRIGTSRSAIAHVTIAQCGKSR
jgi:crotonobetainyl-CoA:carnitine CoA-transferase CaiB-like acyl-CoA transferase